MPYREFHYRWEWQLKSSPEALWPMVADTNRFNRDANLPVVKPQTGNGSQLDNARRCLSLNFMGMSLEWEEEPFQWVRPYRFGTVRRYSSGPIAEIRFQGEMTSQPNGGTCLVYQIWARPRTPLGLAIIPIQIGKITESKFAETFQRYDRIVAAQKPLLESTKPVQLSSSGRARLAALRKTLLVMQQSPELIDKLIETIMQGDDFALTRLRPYQLANQWGAQRRSVLELCLQATRAGLLSFRWELLCPGCRGAAQSNTSLSQVSAKVHCETCNINFTVNFDRSVELTFRPNPTIREVKHQDFCVGGPQVTPHIIAQQLLAPGSQRTLTLPLEAGRYRLRTLKIPGSRTLLADPEGQAEPRLTVTKTGWPNDELSIALMPTLHLENDTDNEQLLILERTAWSDQAVTAAEVTVLQTFRDLFADEALRPGEQIDVGSLAVVFTDLRGSTSLYREIGDARAFGLVMNHFDVLREVIVAEEGSLVKTIGDAVMAVFRNPVAALRAMLKAQQALNALSKDKQPLLLKVGIHFGACIAVTLNERLDYFGSTINLASRLEGFSNGQDIIVSAAVYNDPEVAELLVRTDAQFSAEPFQATLKGFDAERFDLWRIKERTD
ncbi:MAG: adenylate/guanylate cyclase domain-containing protein [Acidobacteriota bacterium]